MSFFKVGNLILTGDEHYDYTIFKWRVGLFILGSLYFGFNIYRYFPADWPKILKFILVIAAGGTCGAILAYFAKQIEALFWWVVLLGVLGGIGYWIWNII